MESGIGEHLSWGESDEDAIVDENCSDSAVHGSDSNDNAALKLPAIFMSDNTLSKKMMYTPRSMISVASQPLSVISHNTDVEQETADLANTKKRRKASNKRAKCKRDDNLKMSKLSSNSAAKLDSTLQKYLNRQRTSLESSDALNEAAKSRLNNLKEDSLSRSHQENVMIQKYFDDGNVIDQIARENAAHVHPWYLLFVSASLDIFWLPFDQIIHYYYCYIDSSASW